MKPGTARGFSVFLLTLLLAVPVVIGNMTGADQGSGEVSANDALRLYGFHLEEVSHSVGIDFRHEAPVLDPKLEHIAMQVASMGASVSIADVDRDGWPDLYTTTSRENGLNALYRNQRDGSFDDVAAAMAVADVNGPGTGVSMGTVWGDYDNDGFEDLFLYKWGRPELFRNEGGRTLTRVTESANLPEWINANTAIWFDYNRDGALDLFIGGYFPERFNLQQLTTTVLMPESLEYARNGGRNFLLRNDGNGRFEDVTEEAGLLGQRWTLAAAAADLRGTGFQDLILANDFGVEDVYFNQEGRTFVSAGSQTGIGFTPKSGMNVALGDLSNEGTLAIYVTNISEPGVLLQGNNLWVPRRDGGGKFDELAGVMGVAYGGWSYGAQFSDFNNDGRLDLFLVNGFVSDRPNTDYWYDLSSFSTGSSRIISDARNWPPMEGRSISGFQQSRLWLNGGWQGFENVAAAAGVTDRLDGRAVAVADLWNRGVQDVVVANQRGPLLVYRNTVADGRNWIAFELEGTSGNRSAIGASVTLEWESMRQIQVVSGGIGFAAQNQRPLHFGLGSASKVDSATIHWPSGVETVIEQPEINRLHHVVENG